MTGSVPTRRPHEADDDGGLRPHEAGADGGLRPHEAGDDGGLRPHEAGDDGGLRPHEAGADGGLRPPGLDRAAGTAARWLAAVRLHRIRQLAGGRLAKRRRRGGSVLRPLGNLLVRRQRVPVQMLDDRRWLEREASMWQALGHGVVEVRGRWLVFRALAGRPLAEALADRTAEAAEKIHAANAAAGALRALHETTLFDGRYHRSCTHGDATAANVIWDEPRRAAAWIDFDVAHRPGLDPDLCRADDLRALCFSAGCRAHAVEVEPVIEAILTGYGRDERVRSALAGLVADPRSNVELWHLAQAGGVAPRRAACREAILRRVG